MKTLVTGGAGYIGATTVQSLLESGHEVLVYDNLSKGYANAVPKPVRCVQGDLADRDRLEGIFRDYRPDAGRHDRRHAFRLVCAAGCCWLSPVDRLRESREPAAGASDCALERSSGAGGVGNRDIAAGATVDARGNSDHD